MFSLLTFYFPEFFFRSFRRNEVYIVKYTFLKYVISNGKFKSYVANTDRVITEIKRNHQDEILRLSLTDCYIVTGKLGKEIVLHM